MIDKIKHKAASVFFVYIGAIIVLTYIGKWYQKNGYYLGLGIMFVLIGTAVTAVGIVAFRYFRRW